MAEVWAGSTIWRWRMKRRFKNAGVTSEETAKKPEELDLSVETLKALEKWNMVTRTKDNRYYLISNNK